MNGFFNLKPHALFLNSGFFYFRRFCRRSAEFFETLNTAGRVNNLFRAAVERMAGAADFNADFGHG